MTMEEAMKKQVSALTAGLCLIAAAVLCLVSLPAGAQDLPAAKLKLIGGISVTSQSKQLEVPFWRERIAKASGGKITVEIQPFNEINLKGPEILRLVARGVADGGTAFLGHMSGDVPRNEGPDLAGLSPDFDLFRRVTDAYRPTLAAHYETLGLKLLGMWSYQAQVMFCREPLKSLGDLKGKKVRTAAASQADFIEYFGGTAVPMNVGEVQPALANGLIDCSFTGTLGAYQLGWFPAAKAVFPLPITWGSIGFVMNAKKWESLPESVRAFLQAQVKGLEDEIWALNRREHQIGLDCTTGKECPLGKPVTMTATQPPESDKEALRKALRESVLPKWAKRCGEACVKEWNATVGAVAGIRIE